MIQVTESSRQRNRGFPCWQQRVLESLFHVPIEWGLRANSLTAPGLFYQNYPFTQNWINIALPFTLS